MGDFFSRLVFCLWVDQHGLGLRLVKTRHDQATKQQDKTSDNISGGDHDSAESDMRKSMVPNVPNLVFVLL